MAPLTDSSRLWALQATPKYTSILILMPNGIMINQTCTKDQTLETVKNEVWNTAKKVILYRLLKDKKFYIFGSVTENGNLDEFHDESKRLCDLRLFYGFLKLIEPEGNLLVYL